MSASSAYVRNPSSDPARNNRFRRPLVVNDHGTTRLGRKSLLGQQPITRADSASLSDRDQDVESGGFQLGFSQLTQNSTDENNENVSLLRFPDKSSFPPLHQNSSVSSSSANGHRYNRDARLQCGLSLDNRSNQSKSLSRETGNQVKIVPTSHSLAQPSSRLVQGMITHRIGIGNGLSNSVKPEPHALSLRARPLQLSQPIPSDSSTNASLKKSERSSIKDSTEKEMHKSLHSELKAYFSKKMELLDIKSKEVQKRQAELDEKVRRYSEQQYKKQSELDRKIDEHQEQLEETIQSVTKGLNKHFQKKTLAIDSKATRCIEEIQKAGEGQLELLSRKSKKYIQDATKAIETLTSSFTQKYDQAVQGFPGMIQPTVVKMVDALLVNGKRAAPIHINSEQTSVDQMSLKRCVRREKRQGGPGLPNSSSKQPSSKKRKQSRVDLDTSSTRRSKRAKEETEKENKTPTFIRVSPCVTPQEESAKATKPKRVSQKTRRTSVSRLRKEAPSKASKASTATEQRFPLQVVELKALGHDCLSPLEDPSILHLTASSRGKRRVKGRSKLPTKRPRRKQTFGSRSWTSTKFQDDAFSFC